MRKQLPRHIGLLVLFPFSFLVLYGVYGYVVAFQGQTNDGFFMFGRSFLGEFLDHPAGVLQYAGRFLGQFYHYPWLGALIVSVSITCFGFLFHLILRKRQDTVEITQTLCPCVLLIVLHTSPWYQIYDTLGLCASGGAFLCYLSIRPILSRRLFALAVTPVLYFALGFYVWIFVVWILADEWFGDDRRIGRWFGIVYAVFSMAPPLVAWRWVLPIPLRSALICPLMSGPPFRAGAPFISHADEIVDGLMAAALLAVLLLLPFWGQLFSGPRPASFWRIRLDKRSRYALIVAVPVLMLLLHMLRYDPRLATVVACRSACKQQRWDDLLEEAKYNPHGDRVLQFMTNYALFHRGRLLDEMFHYPQVCGPRGLVFNFSGRPGLGPGQDDVWYTQYNSDLFYEMGHVNAAFRHAYNNLCVHGKTYDNLRRMAECSMVNGNYEMASKYLSILERTLFHRDFARRYTAIIADAAAADREFHDRRAYLPDVEDNMFGHPAMPFLNLLEARPDNRMAFDYLMAWLLLEKTDDALAQFIENIERFNQAGHNSIPDHCQEAILLWEGGTHTSVDVQGLACDPVVAARAADFLRFVSTNRDQPDVLNRAQGEYDDLYLFYFLFVTRPTPAERHLEEGSAYGGANRVE